MYRAQLIIMSVIGMLVLSAPIALADSGENYSMHGMGAGGWIFGPLMMILMIAIIAGAVVLVLRLFGLGGSSNGNRARAMSILNERFAKGEIDKEEFESRRRSLDG